MFCRICIVLLSQPNKENHIILYRELRRKVFLDGDELRSCQSAWKLLICQSFMKMKKISTVGTNYVRASDNVLRTTCFGQRASDNVLRRFEYAQHKMVLTLILYSQKRIFQSGVACHPRRETSIQKHNASLKLLRNLSRKFTTHPITSKQLYYTNLFITPYRSIITNTLLEPFFPPYESQN